MNDTVHNALQNQDQAQAPAQEQAGVFGAIQMKLRAHRRGSFLVLVVGTLALIAVFTIVYVAIGRSDRQTSVGVARGQRQDEVPRLFADYVAQIIADDAVATFYGNKDDAYTTGPNNGKPHLMREAFDYPWTDWSRRSKSGDLATLQADRVFSPVGAFDPAATGALPASWEASDPWLASSAPTWLRFNSDPPTDPLETYRDEQDWAHISNVAPDGRFVNLFNLRKNFNATHQQMTSKLSLPSGATSTDFGDALDVTIPAHWDSRQVGAFRVAKDTVNPVSDAKYLPYQWADADGDGFYDSRWFELVDDRDSNNLKNLLGSGGRLRWFFATRIVDESSKVNINTATDFRDAPTEADPAGLTPADIDLRRVLSLADELQSFNPLKSAGTSFGPNGYEFPNTLDPNDPTDYRLYNESPYGAGSNVAAQVGLYGYEAIRRAVKTGDLVSAITSIPIAITPAERTKAYATVAAAIDGAGKSGSNIAVRRLFGRDDLAELLTYSGVNDPRITSALETAVGGKFIGTGNAADTLKYGRFSPLRSNRPLSLERDGRDNAENGGKGNGKADADALIWAATDLRSRLTTLSGARPLITAPVGYDAASEIREEGKVSVSKGGSTVTGTDTSFTTTFDVGDKIYVDGETARTITQINTNTQLTVQGGFADTHSGVGFRTEFTGVKIPLSGAVRVPTMFNAYANALAPRSGRVDTWPGGSDYAALRTLNYGYRSPELAIRTAGHLAVNLSALLTGPTTPPPVLTVLLDDSFRTTLDADYSDSSTREPNTISSRTTKWAAWVDGGRADLGDTRLGKAQGTITREARAANVFGVKPQPFITEVSSYIIYSDAPADAGGDTAEAEGFQDPNIPGTCTIRGDAKFDNTNETDGSKNNPDFLGVIFGVQLHNPFDEPITLSGINSPTTQDRFEYYIEYAGRFFRLAQVDPTNPGANLTEVTLTRGETRCFYFTCASLEAIQHRWSRVAPGDVPSGSTAEEKIKYVRDWAKAQMKVTSASGASQEPVWIEEFNPASGARIQYTQEYKDLFAAASNVNSKLPSVNEVRLWRAIRTPKRTDITGYVAEEPDNATAPMPAQVVDNDLLVDRLRDPSPAAVFGSWDRRLDNGNHDITGADAYKETDTSTSNYNTGMTVTIIGTVKRPADPDPASLADGALPAVCIEAKFKSATSGGSLNYAGNSTGGTSSSASTVSSTDFDGGGARGTRTFAQFVGQEVAAPSGSAFDARVETMSKPPKEWNLSGGSTGVNGVAVLPNNNDVPPKTFQQLRLQIASRIKGGSQRLVDSLLPLAVGPSFIEPVNNAMLWQDRWTTLSESLALALNYDSDPTVGNLYNNFGMNDPANGWTPYTDRARLVLDNYVPFEDRFTGGDPNHPGAGTSLGWFTPGTADVRDPIGMPLGLFALDHFRVDLVASGAGSDLNRAIPGVINVNTGTIAALRAVPMLSPSTNAGAGVASTDWWWTPGTGTPLTHATDAAATILALRDKGYVRERPSFPSGTPGTWVSFRDLQNPQSPTGAGENPYQKTGAPYAKLNGRQSTNLISGVRELPGLSGIAEIMTAIDATPIASPNRNKPRNIDFMGFDGADNSRVGIQPGAVSKFDSGTAEGFLATDDYAEKLTIAAGALNSLSVRSDYFTVWFLVHGYQQSDVLNLANTDPLIPTVERRFVMVVDRSQVTKTGQKPRIVLFKEVPIAQ